MIICKYNDMVFMADNFNNSKLVKRQWIIRFLNFFDESDEMFIQIYKIHYPNSSLQIYKHTRKALRKDIKVEIEGFIRNNSDLKRDIRNRGIQKILNFEKN